MWNYTANERLWQVVDFYTESTEAETTYLNAYFMYFVPIQRRVLLLYSSHAVLCRLLFFMPADI